MLKLVVGIGALAIVFTLFYLKRADISGPAAHKLVEDGALLVDVRTPHEFTGGHIDGAINVPVAELSGRLAEMGPKDGAIVVYCQSGIRSARAKRMLRSAGFLGVRNLGSIGNW